MAQRGRKPKPAVLHLVDDTYNATRHGKDRSEHLRDAANTTAVFGALVMPEGLSACQQAAWKNYIEPAWWLDRSKEPAILAFLTLWDQFNDDPDNFVAARHGQMRAYMQDIGLTDERVRGKAPAPVNDEFFDD